jgi:hypothetical protein
LKVVVVYEGVDLFERVVDEVGCLALAGSCSDGEDGSPGVPRACVIVAGGAGCDWVAGGL